MKKLSLIILILFSKCVVGQDTLVSVRGTVTDTKEEKLENLTITLIRATDSVLIKSALTNSTGQFSFKNIASNNYYIKITAAGYETYFSNTFPLSASSLNLGSLKLNTKTQLLKEVVVQSQKPLIEQKVDKMVMNIENSILATGNNALELLEQAPYVSVDQNGGISLRGTQNVTVMIDGKLTYLSPSDLANFLRNTQASQINSIEIITNPSSKYEAAGNGGIINIKMKKNLTIGLNGSFNTNFQEGRLPRITSGLNLNFRKGKFNLYGGVTHAKAERWVEETSDFLFYDNTTKELQSSFSVFENTRYHAHSLNVRAGMDYAYSSKTTIGILVNAFGGGEDENAVNENKIRSFSPIVDSSLLTVHNGKSNWNRFSGNMNLRHQFDSTGKVLTFDFDYADFMDKSNPDYLTDYYNSVGSKIATTYLNANMGTGIKIISLKGDYEHPFSASANFSAGFKWSKVKTLNSIKYFQDGAFDTRRSNDFDYLETINAAYIDFSKEFKQISLKMGLRAEQTISKGTQLTQNSEFKRDYIQFFPTFFIRYKWNESHSSGITINRRIGRPDYESLNPFIYLSDPYNSWGGNPYLQPALTNAVEVNHNYKGIINVFVSYNQTKDALSRLQIKDSLSSGIFTTWSNLGKSTQLSAGVGTFLKVTKWWRMNNNLFVFKTNSSGQLGELTANRSVLSYRIFSINNFTISKKISAELSGFYRPASLWGVSKTGPIGSVSVGVQAKVLNDNWTIKISGGDIFKTMRMNTMSIYPGVDSRYHSMSETRVIRIAFSYRFGRKQVKEQRDRTTASEDENSRVKARD